jgi:hypothetical protein
MAWKRRKNDWHLPSRLAMSAGRWPSVAGAFELRDESRYNRAENHAYDRSYPIEKELSEHEGERRMNDPTSKLRDNAPIDGVRLLSRIRNAHTAAGVQAVGAIREAADATLLSFKDLEPGSVAYLRQELDLPSWDGVRLTSRQQFTEKG